MGSNPGYLLKSFLLYYLVLLVVKFKSHLFCHVSAHKSIKILKYSSLIDCHSKTAPTWHLNATQNSLKNMNSKLPKHTKSQILLHKKSPLHYSTLQTCSCRPAIFVHGRNDESTIIFDASFSIFGPLKRSWGHNSGRSRSLESLQIMFKQCSTSRVRKS